MTIRQADVARELQVSEMTTSRAAKALACDTRPLSDFDAFRLLFAAELQNVGLAPHLVFDLLAEFRHETLFVYKYADRRAWLVFVDTEKARFHTTAMSETHLAALCDLFPMALTCPLHTLAARAPSRLGDRSL